MALRAFNGGVERFEDFFDGGRARSGHRGFFDPPPRPDAPLVELGAIALLGPSAELEPTGSFEPAAVQKIIDAGLDAADKESEVARKAFLLHEAIEGVRKDLKAAIGEGKPDDKKPEDKKKSEEPKKVVEPPKKVVEPPKKVEEPKKTEEPKKPENPQKPDDKK